MQRNSNNKQKIDFIDFSLQYIQVCLKSTQFFGALPDGKAFYPNMYRETFGMFGLSTVKTRI